MPTPQPLPLPEGLPEGTRVVLIGKPGCHLCDIAREVVQRVTADTGARWHELSILDDIALEMAYWEQIPVVLVDGRELSHWTVEEARLRAALA